MDQHKEHVPEQANCKPSLAKKNTRVIVVQLKIGEATQSIRRVQTECEYLVKYLAVELVERPEEGVAELHLTVSESLEQLTQEVLQQETIDRSLLVRDFLRAALFFMKNSRLIRLEAGDLSVITGRLVVNPRNCFVLLADTAHPELIKQQCNRSRITSGDFCRQTGFLVVCLAVGRFDLSSEYVLKNFEELLASQQERLHSALLIKALVEATIQADQTCVEGYIERVLDTTFGPEIKLERSNLENSEAPLYSRSMRTNPVIARSTQEESRMENSNVKFSQVSNSIRIGKNSAEYSGIVNLKQNFMKSKRIEASELLREFDEQFLPNTAGNQKSQDKEKPKSTGIELNSINSSQLGIVKPAQALIPNEPEASKKKATPPIQIGDETKPLMDQSNARKNRSSSMNVSGSSTEEKQGSRAPAQAPQLPLQNENKLKSKLGTRGLNMSNRKTSVSTLTETSMIEKKLKIPKIRFNNMTMTVNQSEVVQKHTVIYPKGKTKSINSKGDRSPKNYKEQEDEFEFDQKPQQEN